MYTAILLPRFLLFQRHYDHNQSNRVHVKSLWAYFHQSTFPKMSFTCAKWMSVNWFHFSFVSFSTWETHESLLTLSSTCRRLFGLHYCADHYRLDQIQHLHQLAAIFTSPSFQPWKKNVFLGCCWRLRNKKKSIPHILNDIYCKFFSFQTSICVLLKGT